VTAISVIGKEETGRAPAGHGYAVEIEIDYPPTKFSCCQFNKYKLPKVHKYSSSLSHSNYDSADFLSDFFNLM
jgi:hypothetical protein